ncbi:cobalamin biosynthesis protein P47K [Halostagnicola larsenii XH-48]|uniref:Cobalamin biosynthesis protein P47K n=1 Tax=Halostagnicola larsenii XH-48 TaxID=797299 RepID=W0JIG2_9EURY|nr:GTP-binding protein [Halostagnicola larsenii]AHF98520.1 cobalamin biosynthesis protein P47K [Halostagnicola larsenii XH-48]
MSVPVTILCGGLGAGKTTLLSQLLEEDDRDIAVLVNDVGEVNVDADLVEARTDLETGDEVVALENGCICCSLGGELSRSVIQLWKEHDFDSLVVEASGVGEPEPIARQFVRGPAGGPYDLDAVVTVADARLFYDTFVDGDEKPVRQGPDESGSRPIADLLLEQVEFCDLLVLNKCDLVSEAERDRVVAVLETLQPRADIVTTEYGSVRPDELLESERFDLEAARESAGWKRAVEASADHEAGDSLHDHGDSGDGESGDEHRNHGDGESGDGENHDHGDGESHDHGDDDHTHPPERYGIDVTTFARTRPFHPRRLREFLEDVPDGLVRAKGLCWIAGRERAAITMSYAGTETTLEVTGRWIASFSEQRQEAYRRGQPDMPWDEEWGDREVRLALIGRNLDQVALESRLEDCLLTDSEMAENWDDYENETPTAMGESTTISSGSAADRSNP